MQFALLLLLATVLVCSVVLAHNNNDLHFEGVFQSGSTTLNVCRRGGRLYGQYGQVGIFHGSWSDDGTADLTFYEAGASHPSVSCWTGRARLEQQNDYTQLLYTYWCFETPETPVQVTFTRSSAARPLYTECAALLPEADDDDYNLGGTWVSSADQRDTCWLKNGIHETTQEYFYSSFVNTSASSYSGYAQGLSYRTGTIHSGHYALVNVNQPALQLEFLLEDGSYCQFRYDKQSGLRAVERYRRVSKHPESDCQRHNTSTTGTFLPLNSAASLATSVAVVVAVCVAVLLF